MDKLSFSMEKHTWYLSQAPQTVLVEKNLSCGKIFHMTDWYLEKFLQMRNVKKIIHIEKVFHMTNVEQMGYIEKCGEICHVEKCFYMTDFST